jgi:hypothetical protein
MLWVAPNLFIFWLLLSFLSFCKTLNFCRVPHPFAPFMASMTNLSWPSSYCYRFPDLLWYRSPGQEPQRWAKCQNWPSLWPASGSTSSCFCFVFCYNQKIRDIHSFFLTPQGKSWRPRLSDRRVGTYILPEPQISSKPWIKVGFRFNPQHLAFAHFSNRAHHRAQILSAVHVCRPKVNLRAVSFHACAGDLCWLFTISCGTWDPS